MVIGRRKATISGVLNYENDMFDDKRGAFWEKLHSRNTYWDVRSKVNTLDDSDRIQSLDVDRDDFEEIVCLSACLLV